MGAAEADAAIVHLHARRPEDGRPDQSPEAFEPFLRVIKQRSDVVVNLTTGCAPFRYKDAHDIVACVLPGISALRTLPAIFEVFGSLATFWS